MKLLVCWIGKSDLDACDGKPNAGNGPIGQAVLTTVYEKVVLLSDWDPKATQRYCVWLRKLVDVLVEVKPHSLSSPTDFQEIYQAADTELAAIKTTFGTTLDLTIHISPGTSQMAAIWIVLAKTRYPSRLIESSREGGVREAIVPFDLSAEFFPAVRKRMGDQLIEMVDIHPDSSTSFAAIIHKSSEMKRSIGLATRVARYPIPVLIEGESGTGKELMAHAIHGASGRSGKIVSVNCGAIPLDLVESEFFGHSKGSSSGAPADRKRHLLKHTQQFHLNRLGKFTNFIQK